MRRKSPRILKVEWGLLEVEGQSGSFKDGKLFPGGAREWDWRETGTRHVPGIQPADIEELLQHGAHIIVLSQGMLGRLQVCAETLQFLQRNKIPFHVLKTKEAVALYNKLAAQNQPVGGLFHTTC